MLRKLLCKLGWHEWIWKFEQGDYLCLSDPPPDNAKCKHCGLIYGKI